MKEKEGNMSMQEAIIQAAIEETFPAEKLIQTAIDLTEEGTGRVSREEIMPLIRKVTTQKAFVPLASEIDTTVTTPAGVKEIQHGSSFTFSRFRILENHQLNQALDKWSEYQPEVISRSTFISGLQWATLLAAIIVFPHDLKQEEIEKITKHHILKDLIYHTPNFELSREGAGLLLYGCLKVIGNKFAHSLENQQPGQI